MKNGPSPSTEIPRVTDLVERFRMIGETSMRDLPFYNPVLEVEAVGFQPLGSQRIGVLITPWFMNLIRLPELPEPMDMACMGRKMKVALPSGERELMQGGDEQIGAFESLSLHSPMFAFNTQKAAREEAERRLADLMQPSERRSRNDNGRLSLETSPNKIARRAFLTGGSSRV